MILKSHMASIKYISKNIYLKKNSGVLEEQLLITYTSIYLLYYIGGVHMASDILSVSDDACLFVIVTVCIGLFSNA